MIKDFLIKKENIFIFLVAMLSTICIIVGFLFLFLKTDSTEGPRIIPNNVYEIKWKDFYSKVVKQKIQYPDYMYIGEQKENTGVGINISEFKPKDFLTYFSNQNHISIYPEGIDNQFFYGKTKKSEYTSSNGQNFSKTEYLTTDNQVWAVMLIPDKKPDNWQKQGFIWIQSSVTNKEVMCLSSRSVLIKDVICDPYSGEFPVYKGEVSDQFLRFGYEIINKNSF